jgi:hypothetical protein
MGWWRNDNGDAVGDGPYSARSEGAWWLLLAACSSRQIGRPIANAAPKDAAQSIDDSVVRSSTSRRAPGAAVPRSRYSLIYTLSPAAQSWTSAACAIDVAARPVGMCSMLRLVRCSAYCRCQGPFAISPDSQTLYIFNGGAVHAVALSTFHEPKRNRGGGLATPKRGAAARARRATSTPARSERPEAADSRRQHRAPRERAR